MFFAFELAVERGQLAIWLNSVLVGRHKHFCSLVSPLFALPASSHVFRKHFSVLTSRDIPEVSPVYGNHQTKRKKVQYIQNDRFAANNVRLQICRFLFLSQEQPSVHHFQQL